MFKSKRLFSRKKCNLKKSIFKCDVTMTPPYDPRLGVMINNVKFHVCMSNIFGKSKFNTRSPELFPYL